MKNSIQKYIIDTQLWVSLMISFLCVFFGLLHQNVDYNRVFIVFSSTIASYNFMHFRKNWFKKKFKKKSFYIFLIGVLIVLFLLYKESSLKLVLHVLFLGVFVLMYNPNFMIQFRSISLVKIFVISFVWSYSVLWVGNIMFFSIPEFFSVFLFVVGLTIPFDICDMNNDSIITIPKFIGVNKSKILSCLCLSASAILFYFSFYHLTEISYIIAWIISCLIVCFMVCFMDEEKVFFYTRFWMEGCSALPFLLVIVQKIRVVFE